ncbi:MAG: glycoside hydrolase family 15 protein [Flavobacteriales bacterium]|nr:glycoside hydrolase family 15 protein [Flavobacteriales bacterium]
MKNLDYGIIGNCKSSALISKTGAIDWCCLPHFDSPSVFAKILDNKKGGTFEIIVDDSYTITQQYVENSNVLSTKFNNGTDAFEVLDFMPIYKREHEGIYNPPDIIRYFKYLSGKPSFQINYQPKLEYAKQETQNIVTEDYIKSYTTQHEYDSLYLYTNFNKTKVLNSEVLELSEDAFITVSYHQKLLNQDIKRQFLILQKTNTYWLDWSYHIKSFSLYNKEIIRSALTLKLLTYLKTGAVLAAATTSLPESIGEERNWDYRFCWIRDASMVVRVMYQIGKSEIAKRFIDFIINIIPNKDEKIQIMYGINYEKKLTEQILEHFSGYENSYPVRIGNAAYTQKQNDIYGVLMDVIYQDFKLFDNSLENSENLWTITRSIVKIVEQNWEKPDKGIWEIRNEEKHFTFSKVLCWVAIDRAIKVAQLIHKKKYVDLWKPLAQRIKDDIHQNAWNEKVQSFTQFYGASNQDASNLLMQSYGFISADDKKFKKTVYATYNELCKDGLMYRYINQDDFGIPSSSFTICTFWMINSLYAIGEKEKAQKMFEDLLSHSNHLGLFSEDIDFKTKRLLGNFPQAYSHLSIIETAILFSQGNITNDETLLETIHRELS